MKDSLKLLLNDRNSTFSLMLLFVLLPTEVDAVTQKGCCKGNAIGALGSNSGKVILALLAEVITFYIGLTTIDVKWFSLQWLFSEAVKEGTLGFEDCFGDFLQIFFCILSNKKFCRGIDWGFIMARLRRGWRSRWTFKDAFPTRAFMVSDRSHLGSRDRAEQGKS